MSTPGELLCRRGWRLRHSLWMLWGILSFGILWVVGFSIIGFRTKKRSWLLQAGGWLLFLIAFIVATNVIDTPEKGEPSTAASDVVGSLLMAGWIGGSVLAWFMNRKWLVWLAHNPKRKPWYATAAAPVEGVAPADTPPVAGVQSAATAVDNALRVGSPGYGSAPAPVAVAPRAVAQPPVAQPPVAQPPVAQPPVAQPPVAQPPVAQPPVAQPPVAQPPVAQPPVAQPPVAPVAVAQPPVAQVSTQGAVSRTAPPPPGTLYVPVASRGVSNVEVNSATREQFAALPGFDLTQADRVVATRSRIGGFRDAAELVTAAGVQPHVFAGIRDRLTVLAPPPAPALRPADGRRLEF